MKKYQSLCSHIPLACVFALGSTIATAYADTTIILEQPVHFFSAEGSDVVLDSGQYVVELAEPWLRVIPSEGDPVDALLLETQAGAHEESLTTPWALSVQGGQPDTHHLVLLLPDGKRLEAIGTYSGIRSRSTLPLLNLQRLSRLRAKAQGSTQSTTPSEFSTPLIGGGGGNRSYNLDCGNGSVLVGAVYKAGMWLDAIGIICQRVDPQTGALGDEFTRGPVGGSGGQARIKRCNSGNVVQGVRGFSGQFINSILMKCSRWEPSRKAPVFSTSGVCGNNDDRCTSFGGNGGQASDTFHCPSGKVGKAFRGKYGWYIDSTRFVCDFWDQ